MLAKIRERLKEKASLLIIATVIIVATLLISFYLLEDFLVENGNSTSLSTLSTTIIGVTQNVTATIQSFGYTGVFILMLLESCSLPIPSEIILPFAGYLVSLGQLNLWLAVLVATVAGVLGSLVDYYIGLKGVNVLTKHKTMQRLLFSQTQMNTVQNWFTKHGSAVVFLSRLVPGFRTIVSFPAGAVSMPIAKFTVYTMAGCLVWDAVLIYAGKVVGASWREIAAVNSHIIVGVVVAALIAISIYLANKLRASRRSSLVSSPP